MTEIEECACDKALENEAPAEPKADCPEDKKIDGKCPEVPKEAPKAESIPSWATDLISAVNATQTNYESLSGILNQLKTREVEAGVRKVAPKPTAQVSNNSDSFSFSKAIEKVQKWIESDRTIDCKIDIPVDVLRSTYTARVKTPSGVREVYRNSFSQDKKIAEALGYTGTQSSVDYDSDVALEPGGTSFVPVTQFAKYKEVAKDSDRARFFKNDLPATGSQTPGTTATVGTMDIESIEVVPSTITGVFLKIDTDDIENNSYDTVSTVVKASSASFDDFIATDMLDTVSAEGTLTPLKWLKGSDGSVITTSDTASVAFDSTAIASGKRWLSNQGLLKGGKKPVCFLDPQQYEELITDTGITNYTQQGIPGITTSYNMAELYGVTLVETNAVQHNSAQTNTAHNAIMCIPGHSYGVASKRTVQVKFHEVPEDNNINVTTNWRIKSGVIDANSIIRISSTSDA